MIDVLTLQPLGPQIDMRNSDEGQGAFSFSAAVSAVEAHAAQSLKTHGAAPNNASGSLALNGQAQTRSVNQTQEAGQQQTQHAAASAQSPTSKQAVASPAHAETVKLEAPSQAPQSTPTPAAALPVLNTGPALSSAATAPASSSVRTEALAARPAEIAKPKTPAAAKFTAPPAPRAEAPSDTFATLLARRLSGGATQFELRLDPPELGRVEANLKLTEKNETVLALTFDSQETLDLFAKDESGLRNALTDAGYDFDQQHIVFALADASSGMDAGEQPELNFIDPAARYAAPYSAGAVDIMI
ncbi:MAG: flagellar hook-length control protein FliK [Pseudomonadota bacterium]